MFRAQYAKEMVGIFRRIQLPKNPNRYSVRTVEEKEGFLVGDSPQEVAIRFRRAAKLAFLLSIQESRPLPTKEELREKLLGFLPDSVRPNVVIHVTMGTGKQFSVWFGVRDNEHRFKTQEWVDQFKETCDPDSTQEKEGSSSDPERDPTGEEGVRGSGEEA